VSDAYDWIRANVCVMSDYPPTYLCGTAEEKIMEQLQDVQRFVIVGLLCMAIVLFMGSLHRILAWCFQRKRDDSSDDVSYTSSLDELECLKSDKTVCSRGSSYDSIGEVEVTHSISV
jgi:hypothetical protein